MPTKEEHLAKSRQNESFVGSVDTSSVVGVEWAITATFYASLHYVEAYFASRGKHFVHHGHRSGEVQKDPKINGAYDDYRELSDISRAARYEYDNLTVSHLKFATGLLESVKSVVGIHL